MNLPRLITSAVLLTTTTLSAQLLNAATPAPAGASVTSVSPMTDADKAAMADKVRAETLRAWEGYRKYAWGHDEFHPITKQPSVWYGHSLLMTPVDALDTLIVMGLKPQADEARELIDTKLDLDQDIYVKDFEITIRLLGALDANYELTGDKRLLALADELGRRMLPMFNSPTGMPYEYVNLHTGAVRGVKSNPAEIGSLLLEYGTLARLTGKQEYYDKAKRALVELYKRRSAIGLVGSEIDVETGKWTDPTAGIYGGIDSYYEYLLKASILFGDKDCAAMWLDSQTAIEKYLADHRPDGLWYGQADMNTGVRTHTLYGSLDAFYPAVLVLAGNTSEAAALQDSSFRMWTMTGIEPEEIDYAKIQDNMPTITAANYELRPEIIESNYYLYHATHDPKYLSQGKVYFDALVKYCGTDEGFAALSDVRSKTKKNSMESFFFAETLKYSYLLFAPDSALPFDSIVFNTEAHPLQRSFVVKP